MNRQIVCLVFRYNIEFTLLLAIVNRWRLYFQICIVLPSTVIIKKGNAALVFKSAVEFKQAIKN